MRRFAVGTMLVMAVLLMLVGLTHIAAVFKYYAILLILGCMLCLVVYLWIGSKGGKRQ